MSVASRSGSHRSSSSTSRLMSLSDLIIPSFSVRGHQIQDTSLSRVSKRGPWQGPPRTCHLNIGARAYSRIDSCQFLGSFHPRQTLSAEHTFNRLPNLAPMDIVLTASGVAIYLS